MPSSDNLYSAIDDESDAESFSDELSPSDGYFNGRNASPQAMVPDPSLDCPPEGKTLIAGRNTEALIEMNARANLSPAATHSDPSVTCASPPAMPASSSSQEIYTPRSPLSARPEQSIFPHRSQPASLLIDGPPPAYSASPTSPSDATQGLPTAGSYGTFSPSLLEQGLPIHHEPQSMGGPVDQPGETTPISSRPIRPVAWRRRIIGKILLVALIFSIFAAFLSALIRSSDNPRSWDPDGRNPPMKDSPLDPMRPHCPVAAASHDFTYNFPVDEGLSVIQRFFNDRGGHSRWSQVSVSGEVRLQRLPKDFENGNRGIIKVSYNLSHPGLPVESTWDSELRQLVFSTPRFADLDDRVPHCISVEIGVWLPEDATLSHLNVEAITLSLRVAADIRVSVSRTSDLTTVSGGVYFPNLDSTASSNLQAATLGTPQGPKESPSIYSQAYPFSCRNINICTVSGNIHGTYPLYDYLNISSVSGDITVDVAPQAAAQPGSITPASLAIHTTSGNINANLPLPGPQNPGFEVIPRDFVTSVETTSGTIRGSFYLGTNSKFESTSGNINITVLPVIQKGNAVDGPLGIFRTATYSGKTAVVVLDPVFIDGAQSSPDESLHSPDREKYLPIGDDDPYHFIPPTLDAPIHSQSQPRTADNDLPFRIHADYGATSGNIKVQYPASWEGIVTAHSMSGSISLRGKDVQIIKDKKGWGFKEVVAKKGDVDEGDESTVQLDAISGKLEFVVGKE